MNHTDPTAAVTDARDRLRGMALSLATGTGPIVDPQSFAAAIDAYGDAVCAAASAAVSPPTSRAAVPTDEDFLVAVEEALEATLLPTPGLGVLERTQDALMAALGPLVTQLRRLAAEAQQQPEAHVCKPGASYYYCPTSAQVESTCHGGFDTCCDRPDLHMPATTQQPAPSDGDAPRP